ncbi:MAG: hypothetical protein QXP96_06445, partial [Thermoproteota archaeon]
VDIVFESKNGKLIVVEVKATTDLENIWEQFERAWKQLNGEPRYNKPGYIQLIKENGLKVFGKIRNDVEAYIIVVVMVNLETGLSSIRVIEEA